MNGFWLALRPAALRLARWFVPVAALTLLLPFLLDTVPEAEGAPLALWLHVPAAIWCALTGALLLDSWPTFGRERAGAAWLERIPGESARAAAAFAVHLLLAAAGLALLGLLFSLALGWRDSAPPPAHAEVPLTPRNGEYLDQQRTHLELSQLPDGTRGLRLHPRALLPSSGDLQPARIQVHAGAAALLDTPLQIHGNDAPVELPLPAGTTEVRLERLPEPGLALWFPPGSLRAVTGAAHAAGWNAALAALQWLLPAVGCAACVWLLRRRLSLPLLHLTWLLLLLAAAFAPGRSPMSEGMRALASGRWLGAEPLTTLLLWGVFCAMTAPLLAVWLLQRRLA